MVQAFRGANGTDAMACRHSAVAVLRKTSDVLAFAGISVAPEQTFSCAGFLQSFEFRPNRFIQNSNTAFSSAENRKLRLFLIQISRGDRREWKRFVKSNHGFVKRFASKERQDDDKN